jgi:hypothetical protein
MMADRPPKINRSEFRFETLIRADLPDLLAIQRAIG